MFVSVIGCFVPLRPMNQNRQAHLAVLVANLFFAINYSIVKYLTPQFLPPLALNLLRIAASVPLFWLLYSLKPSNIGFKTKHLGQFVICAVSGVALNQIMFVKGLSLTLSVHAALLSLVTPIFITAAAAWLLNDAFTPSKALGLFLGISGASLLVFGRAANTTQATNILLGDILIIMNAICYALYFVWVRPLMNEYEPIHVLRWVFTLGMFMVLPLGIGPIGEAEFGAFKWQTWAGLAFVVFGGTFLAYLFNIYGLRTLGPGVVGSYIYTQPVFASIVGILFLNEKLEWKQVFAALLIAAGVFIVNKSFPKSFPFKKAWQKVRNRDS